MVRSELGTQDAALIRAFPGLRSLTAHRSMPIKGSALVIVRPRQLHKHEDRRSQSAPHAMKLHRAKKERGNGVQGFGRPRHFEDAVCNLETVVSGVETRSLQRYYVHT